MSDSLRPDAAVPVAGRLPALRRLDALVGRARLALWWERLWPALWGPLFVVLAFVAASWLGLWLDLDPVARMAGVGLFGLAVLVSLWPFVRLRRRTGRGARSSRPRFRAAPPSRPGARGHPGARHDDPGARALWDLHRRRAEAAIDRLASRRPAPAWRAATAMRCAPLAVVGVAASAFVAGPESARALVGRVRLARRRPALPELPRRRLDRSAPLHPPAAADDRSRGRRAAPARAGQFDARRPRRRAGRRDRDARQRASRPSPAPRTRGRTCARSASSSTATPTSRSRTGPPALRLDRRGDSRPPPEIALRGPARVERARHVQPHLPGPGRLRHRLGRGPGRARRAAHAGPAAAHRPGPPGRRQARGRHARPWSTSPSIPGPARGCGSPRRPGRGRAGGPQRRPSSSPCPQRPFTQAARPRARRAAPPPDPRPRRARPGPDGARRAADRPDRFTPEWGVFLGLRTAARAPAPGQERRRPHRGGRLALGDGPPDRGRRPLGRRERAPRRPRTA